MARMFGTDGVRGVANTELTVETALSLGKAGAYVLADSGKKPLIVVGKDTRVSCDMLEDALCAGIMSTGGNVIKAGVIPTPGIARLVKEYNADAGVVISASHNPFEFNGIKFFSREGLKLSDEIEDRIQAVVEGADAPGITAAGGEIGRVITPERKPVEVYKSFVKSTFEGSLEGVKLILDCSNGASSVLAGSVFSELGADVTVLSDQPDGININDNCGSTHTGALAAAVVEQGAELGLAFDGDADRLIAIDEKGNEIDGDQIIYMIAKNMKAEGKLRDNRVTVTIMSNAGFHKKAGDDGVTVDITDVGDRYVIESMLKNGSYIGGEQSGHIILREYSSTGDGMISALQLLKSYIRFGKPLSELAGEMVRYPQITLNAKVLNENKDKCLADEELKKAAAEAEEKLNGEGRILIRKSGTEPLIRVTMEGSDIEMLENMASELVKLIENKWS